MAQTILPQQHKHKQAYNALPLAPDLPPDPRRQERAIREAAFITAFCPDTPLPNLMTWASQAGEALRAIIDFRSACHRWTAAGSVPEAELTAAYDALDRAGLAGWLDGLIGRGVTR